jgi:hypothetical protein
VSTPALFDRLRQLTGRLTAAPGAPEGELPRFERALAEHLRAHPDLSVRGNRMAFDTVEGAADAEAADVLAGRFEAAPGRPAAEPGTTPAPQVFRRETAFRSTLLGNSVPAWGVGMAPSATFGPFVDEHGLPVWFDVFQPLTLAAVAFSGVSAPVLRVPIRGFLTARTSYRIEAGSAWIASDAIAHVAALQVCYTGLRSSGGTLDLSQPPSIINGRIVLAPTATATLHLDLHQQPGPPATGPAGGDAASAVVTLPKGLDLQLGLNTSRLDAGGSSCTVFGCAATLARTSQSPLWVAPLNQILVPCQAHVEGHQPGRFHVSSSKSSLCTLEGSAEIDPAFTGWLLPVTKAAPETLGTAAGIGALCLTMKSGLSTRWSGLSGSRSSLVHPSVVVEPGLVTMLDFTASNVSGRQRWRLWRNAHNPHASEIVLTFGPVFAFAFISSAANSEGVFCFCSHRAALDRPVDAAGRPFRVESSLAFAAMLLSGETLRAVLLDNDLLSDAAPGAAERGHSIALRNALFTVGSPRSLALIGELEGGRLTKGVLALGHDIWRYLPTLPDPYVASYTPYLRELQSVRDGRLQQSLTAFVKWPDTSPLPADAPDPDDPRSLVYYKLTQAVPVPARLQATRSQAPSFQTGIATFDQDLIASPSIAVSAWTSATPEVATMARRRTASTRAGASARVEQAMRTGALDQAMAELSSHPLLSQLPRGQMARVLDTSIRAHESTDPADVLESAARQSSRATIGQSVLRGDALMLLDVSTRADQMGVTLGPALSVGRDERGATLQPAVSPLAVSLVNQGLPLQVMNMDVVTTARHVRAATLPQISWEPVFNIPLPIEGSPDPGDTITVTPGLVVYDNDGIPTRLFSESPYAVPIAPLPVTRHLLKEFNDEQTPRALHSVFTLPFGMVAQASFHRSLANPEKKNTRLDAHMPQFGPLRGGLQLQALAPESPSPGKVNPFFPGWTLQLDNLRWSLFGVPLTGTTLGKTVATIFNKLFAQNQPKVPLERIEISGYGASIFSNWLNANAAVADVSQTQFDVVVGRTAHEVVQVRSILYPFGVHVVRTITLMRSNNGYVFRSDSGWKAESDGFYDFGYTVDFGGSPKVVANPYEFHAQPVKGVSRVREIRDFPEGGPFTSSFKLNDPDLPPELQGLPITEWQKLFAPAASLDHVLDVQMQPVVFDADVHLDHVVSGGTIQGGQVIVPSRKILGYVQLAPSSILIPSRIFADLLQFQNGSLGGPVDCILDVAGSGQRMRVQRADVNPARNAAGKSVFVTAARGALILPPDGSWAVVRQQTNTGDVTPVAPGEGVPLIKPNASPDFRLAHPADVHQPSSNVHFGVLQSTGTQKVLFDVPHFAPGVAKLKSEQTYFADAYKLLNSKGVFPNVANALGLTSAEREVEILGEGLMRMAQRTLKLDTLLPPNYIYPFIDEPGVLRIYAQYRSTNNTSGELELGLDSAAALADRWKAALSNMRVVVDLGPFTELMWVDGKFDAASGASPKYDKPHLQFGPVLQPVVDILQVLATLTGEDFDRGMTVGMSNAAGSWEYKFNCSKEIPVIKFPSPLQLTINPNPPLKLEAGLKVGFYFNEKLSLPTDLKQLVPACGAYVEFYGRLQVQCFTLAVASVYAVGQVTLGIAADSKAGIALRMKFGFGAEVVVGLPVVANVSVLYMVEVEVTIADTVLDVAGLLLFRGSAEICGGLVAICIQIEAGGSVHRENEVTSLTAQVTFSIDVCVLWVIDINVTEHWEEQRQIA